MAGIGLILAIVIAIIVVIFTVQNAATVSISFIFWHTEMPLAVVIFCAVLAGALLMFCLVLYKSLRDRWKSRQAGKAEVKAEVAALKSAEPAELAAAAESEPPGEPTAAPLAAEGQASPPAAAEKGS
ncbi:MAG: LapA family protein [Gracilibacteraceae bacterium]|jgi:uncharacterized integral membrane protein|nr:LapA family protein [Gracilibacteraceae bacterium]